ncbi:hypothetical protein [Chryseobacterium sp. SIMBA_028]
MKNLIHKGNKFFLYSGLFYDAGSFPKVLLRSNFGLNINGHQKPQ